MKRVFIITVLIVGFAATYGFAQMHEGMMGRQNQQQTSQTPQQGWYYPYPQMMGPGMMMGWSCPCSQMMGGSMMGSVMMGRGMMGAGMMGPGMMGYGMGPCKGGYNTESYQKFLNETADLRRKLHNKKFEYFEALRNPKTKTETITKLEKEIQELQGKIYEKALR